MDKDGIALASHYAEVSRYFWTSVAITYAIFLGYNVSTSGASSLLGTYLAPAAQLLMMFILIGTARRGVHALLVPIIFLWFCYDHLNLPIFG